MRNKTRNITILAAALFGLVSCGDYATLLKSRDYEKQYQEALRYYEMGKDSRAVDLLKNVNPVYNGTERSDTIRFYMSNLLFRMGEYESSAQFFDYFRKNYGRSGFANEAEYRYALSYYMLSPNEERDQTYSLKAITALREYIYRYPEDEKAEKCREMIDELQNKIYRKEFEVGETYYNIGYYTSAITTFKNILKRTPDIPQREEIRYLMLKSYYNYARNSVKSKQRERFYDVVDAYYSLISEFPETEYERAATRMYKNAQAVIDGHATVDDVTVNVKSRKNDIYARRSELQQKILDMEIADRSEKRIAKLRKKLDELEKEIEALENRQAAEEAVELLQ